MQVAAVIGVSFADFWDMTPRELEIYAGAYAGRREQENRHAYQLAVLASYMTSRWVWAKRINIDHYLKNDDEKTAGREMTDDQMLDVAAAFIARYEDDADGRQA